LKLPLPLPTTAGSESNAGSSQVNKENSIYQQPQKFAEQSKANRSSTPVDLLSKQTEFNQHGSNFALANKVNSQPVLDGLEDVTFDTDDLEFAAQPPE
jgi:hypothetical protein